MNRLASYPRRDIKRSALLGVSAIKMILTMIVAFLGCARLRADIAFSPNGDLFVIGGDITKYAPDGTKTTFATLAKRPISLVFDSVGNLFVGDFGGSIFRFSADGRKSTFVTGIPEVKLACDTTGNLFVADEGHFLILKFTPDKKKTTFATGVRAEEMVLDSSGNLFVPTRNGSTILRITSDGVKKTVATQIEYPETLTIDPAGDLFVLAEPGTLFKITPDGQKSDFATNLEISVPFSTCDSRGDVFIGVPNSDSILKFTSDGKKSEFGDVPRPADMAFDQAGNLFVQGSFAIYKFDPAGNKITFASDRLSPDKHWEYQCSDSGEGTGIVKAGTSQVVLDLSDLDSRFAPDAEVVWAPDSKRFAINCRDGSHSEGTDLYQLKDDKWVALASPVDATTETLERAKSAEKSKKSRSKEASDSPDFDSWIVERWTDADTAVLQAHLIGSDYQFIFTLKFDKDGNWKIVKQVKEPAEK